MPSDLLGGVDLLENSGPVDLLDQPKNPAVPTEEPKDLLETAREKPSFTVSNPFLHLGAGDAEALTAPAKSVISGGASTLAGALRMPALLPAFAGYPPDSLLNNPVVDKLDQIAKSYSYKLAKYPDDNVATLLSKGRLVEAGDYAAHTLYENAPQLAETLLLGMYAPSVGATLKLGKYALNLGKSAATTLVLGGQSAAQKFYENDQSGVEGVVNYANSILHGAFEGLGESIGTIPMLGWAEKVLGKSYPAWKTATGITGEMTDMFPVMAPDRLLKAGLKLFGANAGIEFIEEAATQLMQDVNDSVFKLANYPGGVVPTSEYIPRTLEAGLHGAIAAAGFFTPITLSQFSRMNSDVRNALLEEGIETLKGTTQYVPLRTAYRMAGEVRAKAREEAEKTANGIMNRAIGNPTGLAADREQMAADMISGNPPEMVSVSVDEAKKQLATEERMVLEGLDAVENEKYLKIQRAVLFQLQQKAGVQPGDLINYADLPDQMKARINQQMTPGHGKGDRRVEAKGFTEYVATDKNVIFYGNGGVREGVPTFDFFVPRIVNNKPRIDRFIGDGPNIERFLNTLSPEELATFYYASNPSKQINPDRLNPFLVMRGDQAKYDEINGAIFKAVNDVIERKKNLEGIETPLNQKSEANYLLIKSGKPKSGIEKAKSAEENLNDVVDEAIKAIQLEKEGKPDTANQTEFVEFPLPDRLVPLNQPTADKFVEVVFDKKFKKPENFDRILAIRDIIRSGLLSSFKDSAAVQVEKSRGLFTDSELKSILLYLSKVVVPKRVLESSGTEDEPVSATEEAFVYQLADKVIEELRNPKSIYTDKKIISRSGRELAAGTKAGKPVINKRKAIADFNAKAWTKPKVKGVAPFPADAFKTYQEWEEFLYRHEKFHTENPRREGESEGDYENRINSMAMGHDWNLVDEAMYQHEMDNLVTGKGRLDQPVGGKTYEVSSVGDKRFSALYARLKGGYPGRTIEDVYQNTLKGSGKGRPPAKGSPLYGKTIEESYEAYKNLWRIWLKENPEAAKFIVKKVADGYKLTDKFAKTEVNQARALTELADELNLGQKTESLTPNFDKLPSYDSSKVSLTYAGIGSRETPLEVLKVMRTVASELEKLGYTLRSGGAKGADKAFELGTSKKEIFYVKDVRPDLPFTEAGKFQIWVRTRATNNAIANEVTRSIAKEIHPAPHLLGEYSLNLMARNTNQVFGKNLDSPVDFVLAWTPDGAESHAERTQKTGGTGQAIDMASRKGIPVINMARDGWQKKLEYLGVPVKSGLGVRSGKSELVKKFEKPVPKEPMKFPMKAVDNIYGKDTSTFQLIKEGLRTSTTRGYWINGLPKVGQVIDFVLGNDKVRVQVTNVTKVPVNPTPGFLDQWSKKEGWTVEAAKKYGYLKGYQVEFRLLDSPVTVKEAKPSKLVLKQANAIVKGVTPQEVKVEKVSNFQKLYSEFKPFVNNFLANTKIAIKEVKKGFKLKKKIRPLFSVYNPDTGRYEKTAYFGAQSPEWISFDQGVTKAWAVPTKPGQPRPSETSFVNSIEWDKRMGRRAFKRSRVTYVGTDTETMGIRQSVNLGAAFVKGLSLESSKVLINVADLRIEFQNITQGIASFRGVIPFSKNAFNEFRDEGTGMTPFSAYRRYVELHELIHAATGIDGEWLDENLVKVFALEALVEEAQKMYLFTPENLLAEIQKIKDYIATFEQNPVQDWEKDPQILIVTKELKDKKIYHVSYRKKSGEISNETMRGADVKKLNGTIIEIIPGTYKNPSKRKSPSVPKDTEAYVISDAAGKGIELPTHNILSDIIASNPEAEKQLRLYFGDKTFDEISDSFGWDDLVGIYKHVPELRGAAISIMHKYGYHGPLLQEVLGWSEGEPNLYVEDHEKSVSAKYLKLRKDKAKKIMKDLGLEQDSKVVDLPGGIERLAEAGLVTQDMIIAEMVKDERETLGEIRSAGASFAADLMALVRIINDKDLTDSFMKEYPKGEHLLNAMGSFLKANGVRMNDFERTFRDFILGQIKKKMEASGATQEAIDAELMAATREEVGTERAESSEGTRVLDLPREKVKELFFEALPEQYKNLVRNFLELGKKKWGLDTPLTTPGRDLPELAPTVHAATVTKFGNFINRLYRRVGSWIGVGVDPRVEHMIKAVEEAAISELASMRDPNSNLRPIVQQKIRQLKAVARGSKNVGVIQGANLRAAWKIAIAKAVAQEHPNATSEELEKMVNQQDAWATAALEEVYLPDKTKQYQYALTAIGRGDKTPSNAFLERWKKEFPEDYRLAKVSKITNTKVRNPRHYFSKLEIGVQQVVLWTQGIFADCKENMLIEGFLSNASTEAMVEHGFMPYRYKSIDFGEERGLSFSSENLKTEHLQTEFKKTKKDFDDFVFSLGVSKEGGLLPLTSGGDIIADYYVEFISKRERLRMAKEMRANPWPLNPDLSTSAANIGAQPFGTVVSAAEVDDTLVKWGWSAVKGESEFKIPSDNGIKAKLEALGWTKPKISAENLLTALGYKKLVGPEYAALRSALPNDRGEAWVPKIVYHEFVDAFGVGATSVWRPMSFANYLGKTMMFFASPLFQMIQVGSSLSAQNPSIIGDTLRLIMKNDPSALNPFKKTEAMGTLFYDTETLQRAAKVNLSWANPTALRAELYGFAEQLPDGAYKKTAQFINNFLGWNGRLTFETVLGNMSILAWSKLSDNMLATGKARNRDEADFLAAKIIGTFSGAPGMDLYGKERDVLNALIFAKEFTVQMARTITGALGIRGEKMTTTPGLRWTKAFVWGDVPKEQMNVIQEAMAKQLFITTASYIIVTNALNAFFTGLFDKDKKPKLCFENEEGKRLSIFIGEDENHRRKYLLPPLFQELTSSAMFLPNSTEIMGLPNPFIGVGRGPMEAAIARISIPLRFMVSILSNATSNGDAIMIDSPDKNIRDYVDGVWKLSDSFLPSFVRSSSDKTKKAEDYILEFFSGSTMGKGMPGYTELRAMKADPYVAKRLNERRALDVKKIRKDIIGAPGLEAAMKIVNKNIELNPINAQSSMDAYMYKFAPWLAGYSGMNLGTKTPEELEKIFQKR